MKPTLIEKFLTERHYQITNLDKKEQEEYENEMKKRLEYNSWKLSYYAKQIIVTARLLIKKLIT